MKGNAIQAFPHECMDAVYSSHVLNRIMKKQSEELGQLGSGICMHLVPYFTGPIALNVEL